MTLKGARACVWWGGREKNEEEEEETLQITVPIDFHYLLCELPSVWTSSLRECEREKVRKMGGGGGVKKSSGSKSRGWLFLIQPCVTLIRQCIMPLIRSMAQATPKWYPPAETYIKHGKFFHLFLKLSGDRIIIAQMLLIVVCFQINTVAEGEWID